MPTTNSLVLITAALITLVTISVPATADEVPGDEEAATDEEEPETDEEEPETDDDEQPAEPWDALQPPDRPWSEMSREDRKQWREDTDEIMPAKADLRALPKDERKSWKQARHAVRPVYHSGLGFPYVAANAFDGLLVGIVGQYSQRPREMPEGFRMRITASGRFNFSGDYVQAVSDFTYIGKTSFYAKVRFRTQKDYPFAGVGGHGAVAFSDDEYGNAVGQLMYVIGVAGSTPVEGLRWYVGQSTTLARVQAGEGGRMEFISPFGSEGGVYLDIQGGVLYEAKDRLIRPSKGWQLEGAIRFAGSIIGDNAEELSRLERSSFIGGWFIEAIRWQPIYKDWLVLGIRGLFDHTIGARPFYDQNRLGGILRDELGNGQHFTGYGIYRFGGDGVLNLLVEFRGKFLNIHKPRIDLVMHASVYAEEGFLFDGWDPGPHLPTLGVSLDVTIARMVYLRPYLSWGWVQSSEEDPRRAKPFFGITATGTM